MGRVAGSRVKLAFVVVTEVDIPLTAIPEACLKFKGEVTEALDTIFGAGPGAMCVRAGRGVSYGDLIIEAEIGLQETLGRMAGGDTSVKIDDQGDKGGPVTMYELHIEIRIRDMSDWYRANAEAIEAVGEGEPHSSGTGFGLRDMQWSFEDKSKADAARDRVLASVKNVAIAVVAVEDQGPDGDDEDQGEGGR